MEKTETIREIKGLELSNLNQQLHRVPAKFNDNAAATIEDIGAKLGMWNTELENFPTQEFLKEYHRLPLEAFKAFSFDELCKLRYASTYSMHESIKKLFEEDPQYSIIEKIRSSMWRWGTGSRVWNEVVDAYENLSRFKISDDKDFEVRLDHSTYHNEFGYSRYHRIYLDGAFGYMVYYKKRHVMTIGFSIMADKRILVQQIQTAQKTGNRFLYKLPPNKVEHVLSKFEEAFPEYQMYLIDGDSLIDKTLGQYTHLLQSSRDILSRYTRYKSDSNQTYDFGPIIADKEHEIEYYEKQITHLGADRERLAAFYRDAGAYRLGPETLEVNRLKHFQVHKSLT